VLEDFAGRRLPYEIIISSFDNIKQSLLTSCFHGLFLCNNFIMPSRSSKPRGHDFATVARQVVEQTIGEHLDGTPLEDPKTGKNPAAVALGKLGALRAARRGRRQGSVYYFNRPGM
jgi:hypothetical protein